MIETEKQILKKIEELNLEIIELKKSKEYRLGEDIYKFKVDCNDVLFTVCINSKDLLGQPEVGRRFKGQIWMQGILNFEEVRRVQRS